MEKSDMRERLRQVIEQYAKSPSWTPRQEVRQPRFWKTIRAEFIGCFLLMIFSTSVDPYIGPLSYGCTVTLLTYTLRATGVYLNPMVTMAAVLLRSITPFRCVALILAQAIGTLSGATVMTLGLSGNDSVELTSPLLTVGQTKGFGFEFFATFLMILAVSSHLDMPVDETTSSIISGVAVGVCSAFARRATGGFLNPLRAFSLALFQDVVWSSHYIYCIGPILGSLLAVFTYDFIRFPKKPSSQDQAHLTGTVRGSILTKHEDEFTQQDTEFTLATLT